jgi:ubiquinone/menaquinone biosynthesis C-methylase UbiE
MVITDNDILPREEKLRDWFTRKTDGLRRIVDGLDIGWGGVQLWATSVMPDVGTNIHLDFACGYATFLAELGWRFPKAELIGLNIDFEGAHAIAGPLLREAEVDAKLIKGDARSMPFPDASFDSASCFMGLQDIEVAFGDQGVRQALNEAIRVLRIGGILYLLDEYSFERYDALLSALLVKIESRAERSIDVKWNRKAAEYAIGLYAEGWLEQKKQGNGEVTKEALDEYVQKLMSEADHQLSTRGFFVPFGPIRMIACRKPPNTSQGSST